MSSKNLAARAARINQRPSAPEADPAEEAAAKAPAARPAVIRADPIRVTTDLAPQSYRALIGFCADLAAQLGRAKVAHTIVIRELVAQLEADKELQAAVAESVRQQLRK